MGMGLIGLLIIDKNQDSLRDNLQVCQIVQGTCCVLVVLMYLIY